MQGGLSIERRAREHLTGAWTNGADADGKAVWSWRPLLASSRRRQHQPNRVWRAIFADDGDKTNSSPGRARNKPLKPLRRECRVFRGTCGDYRVLSTLAHGLWVQRAPGIPGALSRGSPGALTRGSPGAL